MGALPSGGAHSYRPILVTPSGFYTSIGDSGNSNDETSTDRIPPSEFNLYIQDGFYGHPFIVGDGLPRLEFKDRSDLLEWVGKAITPEWSLGAHWAPLGWTFVTSDSMGFQGDAVVACRGSWNSSEKVGYRIERIMFDPLTGRPTGRQKLVGLLRGGQVLGRPCDIAEAADDSLFFSDNSKGRIYRIAAQ